MWAYPLKTVLELRRREEEAAAIDFANATHERCAAELEESRRYALAQESRARWEAGTRDEERAGSWMRSSWQGDQAGAARAERAEQVVARAHFSARLRERCERAERELDAFRAGPLAAKRAAAAAAELRHVAARQALQALRRHEAAFALAARRSAERREDDAREEISRAQSHARAAGDRRP